MSDSSTSSELSSAETLLGDDPAQSRTAGGLGRSLERGDAIGRYLVLGRLGSGGMGVVYSAYDPELDRRIAIKVLRQEPDDRARDDRHHLLREAQAMARIHHPNVVAVHDVGTHDGRVYIAMEFVEGETLRKWVTLAPRTWRETIDVLAAAGRALQAVHDERLVHGDFKPDNVMVANDGRVLVMDFGLAWGERVAAIEPDALVTSRDFLSTKVSGTGGMVGTPAYMSPEQHAGRPADPRSDQFGMCVTLWEALFGVSPFPGRQLPELVFSVSTGKISEPPPGSTVPGFVRRAIERGLHKDPDARWPSIAALFEALDDRASRRRRSRLVYAGAAIVVLGTIGAVAWSQRGEAPCSGAPARLAGVWDDARRGEVEHVVAGLDAKWATATMTSVNARLDTYADEWIAAHTDACRATTVYGAQSEAMMDLRIGCLEHARMELQATAEQLTRADPEVLERAHTLVASLPALASCADVEALGSGVAPPAADVRDQVDALRAAIAGARAAVVAGRYDEAAAALEPLAARVDAVGYLPVRSEYLHAVGQAEHRRGNTARAQATTEQALRLALGTNHERVAMECAALLVNLVANEDRRAAQGLVYANLLLGLAERRGEPRSLRSAHSALAMVYSVAGKLHEAEANHRRALELDDGTDLATTGRLHHLLGITLTDLNQHDAALGELRIAVDALETALGPQHPSLVLPYVSIGNIGLARNRFDDAAIAFQHALEISRGSLGPEHPSTIGARFSIATILANNGRHAEAEAELRELLALFERTRGADHANVGMVRANLAAIHLDRSGYAEAEAEARRAIAVLRKSAGPENADLTAPYATLARSLAAQDRHEEALVEFRRVLAIREQLLGKDHSRVGVDLTRLSASLVALGRDAEARPLLERAVTLIERDPEAPKDLAVARFELARALWSTDRARAQTLAEQALPSLTEEKRAQAGTWLREHGAGAPR